MRWGNKARGHRAFARFALSTMLGVGVAVTPFLGAAASSAAVNPSASTSALASALASAGTIATPGSSRLSSEAPPPNAIELSVDGVHWSNPLNASPFDDSLIWVPGDSQIGSVWVRTTCEAASGVATWELEPDNPPLWADDLLVRTRAGGGEWDDKTTFSDCQAVTEFTVTAGEPVRLDLEIIFPFGDATSVSVNDTQLRVVDIDNAAIVLSCDGVTTTRPALRQCEPPIIDSRPNNGGGSGGNGGSGNNGGAGDTGGSGNNGYDGSGGSGSGDAGAGTGDGSGDGSQGPSVGVDSVSGILAYAANGQMPRTGVELLTTALAVALLAGLGVWLVVSAKRWRAGLRHG